MNPLSLIKLGSGAIGLLLVAALVYFAQDRFDQKAKADDAKACAAAATDGTGALDRCLPNVKLALERERQAKACNLALLPSLRAETRFAMAQSCPAGVKALVARMDVAEGDREILLQQLAEQRQGAAAAVARAEARAELTQERDRNARDAISAAPRGVDGRITCDAGCLRRLGGN